MPLVSCLMVTADRPALCRRAIRCYNRQTYPNRELVVVEDSTTDLAPVLADVPAGELVHRHVNPDRDLSLGALRNLSLEAARGDLLTQWDDDDWYHRERVAHQVAALHDGYDACCLHGALMHVASPRMMQHPYIGYLPDGVPGTIMHRRNASIRYPELARAEDSVFLKAWPETRRVQLPREASHLFIRCYHGDNTWEKTHFLTRMRNTPRDFLLYAWHRFVRGDLFGHPRFQLYPEARAAFVQYLEDSVALGLFAPSEVCASPFATTS